MKAFWSVFEREIAERRLLFLIGLVGFMPFLMALSIFGSPLGAADQRSGAALILSGIASGVLALGLGASVLARDLAERRLGFYFSRPLSGWAIWAGKLGAALALPLGVGLLVLLPALLFESVARRDLASDWREILIGAAAVAALVLLADVVSVMVRSRSPWLGLDLLAAGAVLLLGWNAAERLVRAGIVSFSRGEPASTLLARALLACAPLAVLALLAGSAAQVLGGRTDPRRGHRLLSAILWSLLLAGALGLFGYSRWLVAATPADLVAIDYAAPAHAGGGVLVQGRAAHRGPHYRPLFLIDAESGRFERIFALPVWWGQDVVQISADGTRAVWLEPQDLQGRAPAVLVRLDLTRPGARPIHTPLTFANSLSASLVLSPDGRRLATVERGRLVVEDLETARLLASFPVEVTGGRSRLLFLDGTHLRYFQGRFVGNISRTVREARIVTLDFDLTSQKSEEIGSTAVFDDFSWEPSPDGSHLLVHRPGERLDLFTARGEAVVTGLPAQVFSSGFLSDGHVVVSTREAGRRELSILSSEGVPERRFSFPDASALRLGGEPLPGHLVVAVREVPATSRAERPGLWESRLLDLATGESRPLGRGLLPAAGPTVGPASAGSRLFFRDGDRLVQLDPVSGRERQVAGPRGR